ncbi:MAG: hypothetical protein CBB68_15005 [Rhodospirillaceae bacterium TMED8]|nr:hypothetical protein [Magnetovibrio sp.]OUT47737.1 MAG: hypothetical protein CBB68_15005 [Rhodospirillaceae bacterium TMED8]
MEFLKKIFKRSSDDNDEDDFNSDQSDLNDDESFDDGEIDPDHEDESSTPDPSETLESDQLVSQKSEQSEFVGSDPDIEEPPFGDRGDDEVKSGGDDPEGNLDNEENSFEGDSNSNSESHDDDVDAEQGEGKRNKIIFSAVAGLVVVASITGGAAFWMLGEKAETTAQDSAGGRLQMALPPRAGSLNAVGSGSEGVASNTKEKINAEDRDSSEPKPEDARPPETLGSIDQPKSILTLPQTGGGGSLNALAGATSGAEGLIIPSVTAASYRRVGNLAKGSALTRAPDKALLETVAGMEKPVPVVDAKGRKSWEVYARPLTGDERGKQVALLVSGLGLSKAATFAAIRKLPPEVGLVFEPYGTNLKDWLLRARRAGHEVFLSLPMESRQFPKRDAGPDALTTSVQMAENMKRLLRILGSFGGYVGVVSSMGSKFSTADGQLRPVLEEIQRRGLMYVDAARTSKSSASAIAAKIDLPAVKSTLFIDEPPSERSIKKRLRTFEKIISKKSNGIGIVRPYPISIHHLQIWTKSLAEKNLVLVPVSSLVGKQSIK